MKRSAQWWLIAVCSIVALLVGALQAYGSRDHVFVEDSVSYLDLSDAVLTGDWSKASNSYWSVLYPATLALFRLLTGRGAANELVAMKMCDLFLYALTLAAFVFFLKEMLRFADRNHTFRGNMVSELLVISAAFSWWWWASLFLGGVYMDTPDKLVSAALFTASALILRLKESATRINYALLGVVLGLGFLAKAIMFPIALVYIAVATFGSFAARTSSLRAAALKVSLVVACFSLLAAPQIAKISWDGNAPTFGDSGTVNYALFVDQLSFWHPEGTTMMHAPRVLQAEPRTYEFATPITGTYPIWTDPAYWFAGVSLKPSINSLLLLILNLKTYAVIFGVPLIAAVFLISPQLLRQTWQVWTPALVGLLLPIAVLHMDAKGNGRYISASLTLIGTCLIMAFNGSRFRSKPWQNIVFLLAFCSYPLLAFGEGLATTVRIAVSRPAYTDFQIANTLRQFGLRNGDRVAFFLNESRSDYRISPIAPPLEASKLPPYYWARLGGFRVVAAIESDEQFLHAPAQERGLLRKNLSRIGVKAIVHIGPFPDREGAPPQGWRQVVDHQCCFVRLLDDTGLAPRKQGDGA